MNLNLLELVPEYFKCPFCGRWHKCHKYTPQLISLSRDHFVSWPCTTYAAEHPEYVSKPNCTDPEAETALLVWNEYMKMQFIIHPRRPCQYNSINIVIDMEELKEESEKHPTVTANLQVTVAKCNTHFRCEYCDCRGWCKLATKDNPKDGYFHTPITLGLAFKKEEFDKRVTSDDTRLHYKNYNELEVGPDYDDPVSRVKLYDTEEEELKRRQYGIC